MKTIDFETSRYRKEIADDYCRAVVQLDERLLNGQISREIHEQGHEYAWQTMLRRQKALAETYKI